jgi:hypothetical protein
MIHMHYFELCFTKSRSFAGVRLWLGDYHYPYSRAAEKGNSRKPGFWITQFSETRLLA